MLRALDLVAPTKEVKTKKRRPKLWYNEELRAKENSQEQGMQMVQIQGG